jgi:hypothetical protein
LHPVLFTAFERNVLVATEIRLKGSFVGQKFRLPVVRRRIDNRHPHPTTGMPDIKIAVKLAQAELPGKRLRFLFRGVLGTSRPTGTLTGRITCCILRPGGQKPLQRKDCFVERIPVSPECVENFV